MTDRLPAGLTATALGEPGWDCTLATLTWTRGDVLASGAGYPPVMVTVNVSGDAPPARSPTPQRSPAAETSTRRITASDPTSIDRFIADAPPDHPFFPWIEALLAAAITAGCSVEPPQFCPASDVTRGQIAVFLLRGSQGAPYQPPPATGMFADVPIDDLLAPWIADLERRGLTSGCSASPPEILPARCGDARRDGLLVTRGQVAVFLVRAFGLPL